MTYNQSFNSFNPLFDVIFGTDENRFNSQSAKMNILETENDFRIALCVPGFKKEDLTLTLDNEQNLVVEMSSKEEKTDVQRRYLLHQFDKVQCKKKIALPKNVKREAISATVLDGILTITLPKLTEDEKRAQHQTIEIL